MEHAIGIDLGCTHIKAILVKADGTVVKEIRQDTDEQNDAHWKQSVKQIIAQLKKETSHVQAIGLSAPGLSNAANTCIEFMPGRLPGLENFNWSDYTGERIYVLNDAHAALMAEAACKGAALNVRVNLVSLDSAHADVAATLNDAARQCVTRARAAVQRAESAAERAIGGA